MIHQPTRSDHPLQSQNDSDTTRASREGKRIRPLSDMPSPASKVDKTTNEGRGHFFGLHYPSFIEACKLGLNHAIAYLILARGTQGDNRTSTWSTNSIEGYTRVSRNKARDCIDELSEQGIIERVGGSKHRPIRTLFPLPSPRHVNRYGDVLSSEDERIMHSLPRGSRGLTKQLKASLERLSHDDWVEFADGAWSPSKTVKLRPPRADLTWLPNSLVDGLDGASSPVELVRQTQNVWTLALLVALYRQHELTFSQGVPHEVLVEEYTRKKIREFREFDVFQFDRSQPAVAPDSDMVVLFENSGSERPPSEQFYDAFDVLNRLGLVAFISHLLDGPEGEVLFPLAEPRNGADVTEAEGRLFKAVMRASLALDRHNHRYAAPSQAHGSVIVPIQNHMRKVQLRGIARLRHRPRTMVTAEWLAQSERWQEWAEFYENLRSEIRSSQASG